MAAPELAPEVRSLLRDHVNTFEKLDVLLLLRRRQVALDASVIANLVELSIHEVKDVLTALCVSGLVIEERPGRFRYHPKDASQRDAVTALARQCEDNAVLIVQWMSRNAIHRLHSTATNALAEAIFRRKKSL